MKTLKIGPATSTDPRALAAAIRHFGASKSCRARGQIGVDGVERAMVCTLSMPGLFGDPASVPASAPAVISFDFSWSTRP